MVHVAYKPYCVKCKHKVQPESAKMVVLQNSRKALKGVCPHCGTNVTRILADCDTKTKVGL